MAQDTKFIAHDIIWHFSVSDPRLHSKGFTVYKVSCKNFPVKSPETITEIVCWKRYNDFRMLHKSLVTLHKAQQINDHFPEFAKPTLFGRFAESVIEKRRQSAIELLNFISIQPHLYKSSAFKEFLEEGRVQSDFNKRGSLIGSRSSSLSLISSTQKVDVNSESNIVLACPKVIVQRELKLDVTTLPVRRLDNEIVDSLDGEDLLRNSKAEQTMLEGTWKFPQVADNISLDSSTGDETVDTDDESALDGSLPDADLACFNPVRHGYTKAAVDESSENISRNASWLAAGLNMCAVMGSDSEFIQDNIGSVLPATSIMTESSYDPIKSTLGTDTMSPTASTTLSSLRNNQTDFSTASSTNNNDLHKFDSVGEMSQSSGSLKTECGRGDLDLSLEFQIRSSSFGSGVLTYSGRSQSPYSQTGDTLHSDPALKTTVISSSSLSLGSDSAQDAERATGRKPALKHNSGNFLKNLISGKPVLQRPRSLTEQSVSTMNLGGKDDYIYQAANQICKAQNCEVNGDFEMAFAYYKSGVGILLHGVQGDKNKFRRDVVRRKTAKYLMKAEDIFNRYLASENAGDMRWGTEHFLSPSLDPSFAFIRGSAKELRNFQVLATVDRVILVRHKVTDETFVIKSISKSTLDTGSTQSILPTSCPYMVSLHRFYETEDSVFLLLEYASGGKLWTYIEDYLNSERNSQTKMGLERDNSKIDCKYFSNGARPKVSNMNEDTEQDRTKLNNVFKEGRGTSNKNFNQISEDMKQDIQHLKTDDVYKLQMLNSEISQSCSEGKLPMRHSQNETFDVDKKAQESDSLDIFNSPDLSDVHTCTDGTLPLDKGLSGLSDDCVAVGEQDSCVISPISLPEENSSHSLFKESGADCEAVSNTSINIEDTDRNFSFCDIYSIPTNTELNNSSVSSSAFCKNNTYEELPVTKENILPMINEGQTSSGGDLSSNVVVAFSSDDIIRKSRELLTQVEKVLTETNNRMEKNGDNVCEYNPKLKFLLQTSDSTPSKYEDIISSVSGTSCENVDTKIENALPSSLSSCPVQTNLDAGKYVNMSNANINDPAILTSDIKTHLLSQSREKESPVSNTVSENLNGKDVHFFTSNINSLFGQGSTPRKRSIGHISYKGMTRSASFECDFRSPTRNRAKTVAYLLEHINSTSVAPAGIPESFIRKWMAQMVTAVSRLHSLGVVCRDLKPSNILLGDGGQVYLTYFCKLGEGDQILDWDAKENLYTAPEVGSVNRSDRSCDWWSIGALLYELVVGRSLSECHPGGINSHTCLHIPTFVSDETRGLLEGLLRYNPNERLGSGMAGSEEIKAHPFFTGVDWHSLEYS